MMLSGLAGAGARSLRADRGRRAGGRRHAVRAGWFSFAAYARSVLYNGLGRYDAARDAARRAFERNHLGYGPLVVPELAEAAARTGDMKLVTAMLGMAVRTHPRSAHRLGARNRSQDACAAQRGRGRRELLPGFDRATGPDPGPGSAGPRSPALREWLRRERRRSEAREQTAHRSRDAGRDGHGGVRRAGQAEAAGHRRDGPQAHRPGHRGADRPGGAGRAAGPRWPVQDDPHGEFGARLFVGATHRFMHRLGQAFAELRASDSTPRLKSQGAAYRLGAVRARLAPRRSPLALCTGGYRSPPGRDDNRGDGIANRGEHDARSGTVTTWLNTSFEMQFRVIDGLTVRFAQSDNRGDHALLLSPWPESLLAFEPDLVTAGRAHPFGGHRPARVWSFPAQRCAAFADGRWPSSSSAPPTPSGLSTRTLSARYRHRGRAVRCGQYRDQLGSLVVGSGAAAVPAPARRPARRIRSKPRPGDCSPR